MLRHSIAIFLLGIFLSVKVLSVHAIVHILEGDDIIVENCIDCEYQLQINEVPAIEPAIAQIQNICTVDRTPINIIYVSPFTTNDSAYSFSNKAPPFFA